MSRFVRNSIFGTMAAASSTLAGLISGLIVARVLGIQGSGSYAIAVWVIAVTTTIAGAGLPSTLSRYLPEMTGPTKERDCLRLAASLLRPVLAFNGVPIVVAGSYALWLGLHDAPASLREPSVLSSPVTCMLIGLCCSAQSLGDFTKGFLRGRHKLDLVAKLTSVGAILQLVTILVGSLTFGIVGALVGYLVGALLPAIPLLRFRGVPAEIEPGLRRRITRYATFRWMSEIAGAFVFARAEVFFLQIFWGVTAVGLLSASLTLANLAVQGPLMMTWGLLPRFAEHVGRKDLAGLRQDYATGLRMMAFLIFPACFGLAAIVPELLPVLFGRAFAAAIPSAEVLVCGAAVAAIGSVTSNLIWAVERSDVDLGLCLSGAVISVLGGVFLIAPFGIMGAAVSRVTTQVLAIALASWFASSRFDLKLPFGALARILTAALICAAVARGCVAVVHGWSGIAVAVTTGAVAYFVAVRLLGALEAADAERLRGLLRRLPRPVDGVSRRLMRFAVG